MASGQFLDHFSIPDLFDMSPDIARKACDLRAAVCIKAPGVIQIATAILHGATAFLTNDRIFEKVKEIDSLALDKFLKS